MLEMIWHIAKYMYYNIHCSSRLNEVASLKIQSSLWLESKSTYSTPTRTMLVSDLKFDTKNFTSTITQGLNDWALLCWNSLIERLNRENEELGRSSVGDDLSILVLSWSTLILPWVILAIPWLLVHLYESIRPKGSQLAYIDMTELSFCIHTACPTSDWQHIHNLNTILS